MMASNTDHDCPLRFVKIVFQCVCVCVFLAKRFVKWHPALPSFESCCSNRDAQEVVLPPLYVRLYVRLYVCTAVCTVCLCMSGCMSVCMVVSLAVCMYGCIYVCIYVRLYVWLYCIYVCIYGCIGCMYGCMYSCPAVYMAANIVKIICQQPTVHPIVQPTTSSTISLQLILPVSCCSFELLILKPLQGRQPSHPTPHRAILYTCLFYHLNIVLCLQGPSIGRQCCL